MSAVFWCDYGDHAAKFDDNVVSIQKPAKKITVRDQFGAHVGEVGGETIQMCQECSVVSGLVTDYEAVSPDERHKAIENTVKGKK